MANAERCCKQVYGGSFVGHRCTRLGKLEHNGKWYCGTHDPVAIEAKRKKRHAKWDAEWKRSEELRNTQKRRAAAIEKLCGHIATEDLKNYELVAKGEHHGHD